ncbi:MULTISPECIES: hypothetical protein [Photorhabdus]|nr:MULTISPECIES: hypothetical protein [Photorhabdus]MDB6370055.1 hypothetical protein [Photorhabdus bodei]
MTGVSECSQQRGNLKDDGYNDIFVSRGEFFYSAFIFQCISDY